VKEYEIEKSSDGIHFTRAGRVQARNGTSDASYTFADPQSISNAVYYRLKLITTGNNSSKYSGIITLYNRNAAFKISAVNPFRNTLKLDVFLPSAGNIELNLRDSYGSTVNRKIIKLEKGNSQILFDDVDNLPAGLYILTAVFNGTVLQNKLIKTN
jgi:hypothetical protein